MDQGTSGASCSELPVHTSPLRVEAGSGLLLHLTRCISELWRRVRLEFTIELPLLRARWKTIFFGLIMQYVHGIFTQLAHRMHQPQDEPLHDVGFDLTPELGPDQHWVSEAVFGTAFAVFVLWTFSPFVMQRKRFYTAVMWSRLLMVLVGILTYNEYGSLVYVKAAAWALGMVVSCLIVASRKHYTVDVVIAWYTVPLVFYTLYRRWTTRRPISETFTMINNSDTCSNSSQLPSHVQMTLSEASDKVPQNMLSRIGGKMSVCRASTDSDMEQGAPLPAAQGHGGNPM